LSKNSHQLGFLSPLELKNREFATLFGLNVAFICFKQSFYTNASCKYQLNLFLSYDELNLKSPRSFSKTKRSQIRLKNKNKIEFSHKNQARFKTKFYAIIFKFLIALGF